MATNNPAIVSFFIVANVITVHTGNIIIDLYYLFK